MSAICPRGCGSTVFSNSYGERICALCARTFGEVSPSRASQPIPDHNAALIQARAWEGVPTPEEEQRDGREDAQKRLAAQKRFAEVRHLGYGIPDAARQAGVSARTGHRYEKEVNDAGT